MQAHKIFVVRSICIFAILIASVVAHADTLTVDPGKVVTIAVTAEGTMPFIYQWRKNGVDIPGATNSTYSIDAATASSAGAYTALVTNPYGSSVSDEAVLTVNNSTPNVVAPTIWTQPVAQTVTQGSSATFSVEASGTALNYQWFKNEIAISGATSSSYTISSTALADAGTYWVVISNTAGSVSSAFVSLVVNALVIAPTITTQPVSMTVTEGNAATFSVVASGTGLSYQWLKDGTSISGATSSSYTIAATALTDAGTYSVYVANTAGYVLSNDVILTVNSSLGFAELTPASYSARGANSSAEGVAMLFDGKTTTKWMDNSASTWVLLTFAAPTVLDAYSLTSASDAPERDPVSWTLSGSNDGVTWNVIETRTDQTWAMRQFTRDFVLSTKSAAYTQFRFNFNATSGSVTQLAELELYGSTVISNQLTPSTYSARGQASKSYAIAKLFDGSASTRWIDNSATSWVRVGMKAATTLRRYTLTSGTDSAKYDPVSWTLYGSNDGTNWTAIETRTGQAWSSRKLKRDFTLTTASSKFLWFRFNFQTTTGYYTTELAEMQLFGEP